MRPYFPGGELNALATAPQGSTPTTPSSHRLRRGLPGYLILFAPHAFASQRQLSSRWPPSPPVFHPISTNFTSTWGIPPSSPTLKLASFGRPPSVELRAFTPDLTSRLHALYDNNSEQRLHPLYYRGCWHRVSRCFFSRYRQAPENYPEVVRPGRKCFTIRRPSSHTRRCCIRLSPIVQNSPLLPPVGVWTVSQFQCG